MLTISPTDYGDMSMKQSSPLFKVLKSKSIDYRLIKISTPCSREQNAKTLSNEKKAVLRSVFLQTDEQPTLVILPYDEIIDFETLNAITDKPIHISQQKECETHDSYALPINASGEYRALIAQSIEQYKTVIFESGQPSILIEIAACDLIKLVRTAKVLSFTVNSKNLTLQTVHENQQRFTPDDDKRKKLERLYKLPAMPQMASELILLKNNSNANAHHLAALIEKDPSLTAQIIRYSKSAFFNYKGDINSVSEAISRVIGFDSVINIALGLAVGKKLKNPPDGPLGLNQFWRHAVYSATLAQTLSKLMPKNNRPKQDLAYLSGLLHNFGFLLLGHLFQPEFFLLNRLYASNLSGSITCIEKHALGMGAGQNAINMGHSELGAWLLEKWLLPEEVVTVAREHHNERYDGEHANYTSLMMLVDNALGLHGLGDNQGEALDERLCSQLKLSPETVHQELKKLIANSEHLDMTIQQFAA